MSESAAGILASRTPWEHRAAQAIRNKRDVRVIRERTDVVVRYLLDRPLDTDPDLRGALVDNGLDDTSAKNRAREMLDRALFGGYQNAATILGLGTNAGTDDIRQQYKRLVQLYHPDRSDHFDTALGNERVQQLRKAYEELSSSDELRSRGSSGASNNGNAGSSSKGASTATSSSSGSGSGTKSRRAKRAWPEDTPDQSPVPKGKGVRSYYRGARSRPSKANGLGVVIKVAAGLAAVYLGIVLLDAALQKPIEQAVENAPAPEVLKDYPDVHALVQDFEIAYGVGSVEGIMRLFSRNGSDNELTERDAIRLRYAKRLKSSSKRRIEFNVHTVWEAGPGVLSVEGVLENDLESSLSTDSSTLPFRLRTALIDGQLRILSFEYKNDK